MDGIYQLQIGEPYWMPEVGLGIGRSQQLIGGVQLEILCWYDVAGHPYPTPDEIRGQLAREYQRAEIERQRAEKLAQYVRSLGIDPDNLPSN